MEETRDCTKPSFLDGGRREARQRSREVSWSKSSRMRLDMDFEFHGAWLTRKLVLKKGDFDLYASLTHFWVIWTHIPGHKLTQQLRVGPNGTRVNSDPVVFFLERWHSASRIDCFLICKIILRWRTSLEDVGGPIKFQDPFFLDPPSSSLFFN